MHSARDSWIEGKDKEHDDTDAKSMTIQTLQRGIRAESFPGQGRTSELAVPFSLSQKAYKPLPPRSLSSSFNCDLDHKVSAPKHNMKLSLLATMAAIAVAANAAPNGENGGAVYIPEQDATCTVNGSGDISCVPGKQEPPAEGSEDKRDMEKRIFLSWLFRPWWDRWAHHDGPCYGGDACFVRCARRSYSRAQCGGPRGNYNCHCDVHVDYHDHHSHVYRNHWWW